MKRITAPSTNDPQVRRQVERALRAEHDPYFGRRRPAGEMGRNRTKAAADKRACRGKSWD